MQRVQRKVGRIGEGRIHRITGQVFGAAATERLQGALLPDLRWNQEIYGELLGRYLDAQTCWLDAGCGHHLLAAGLEDIEHKLKYRARLMVGVDLGFSRHANEPEWPLRACADLDRLPFADGVFQLITCNMVVEHLKRPAVTFQELTRILAPGGRLVIHTPNSLGYAVLAGRLAKAVLPRKWILKMVRWAESREPEDVFPTFYRANTMRQLKTLLCGAGLSEISSQYLLSPQPVFRRFAPIAFFELLLQRASLSAKLRFLRGTILISYEKTGHKSLAGGPARPADLPEVATGRV